MNQVTVSNSLQSLCESLKNQFQGHLLFYGEAVESLVANQAGNYVNKEGQFCAVNDSYDLVCFFIRESASSVQTPGPGRNNALMRTVNFRLVVNSKVPDQEFGFATILNSTPKVSYIGSNFDNKSIALQYFGLEERNFETYFFTIEFSAIEKIDCIPC